MIICVHITTLSMVRDATMCDHADTHTHTHVDTLVSLVWLSAGSYLQTWEWTCPCWQHTLPVTCSPGPSQSPAEQLRDSPPGGKSGSWAPPLPISINLMPSHHTVAKMRCAKHCQINDCTPPVRIIPKQARSFPKMSSLPAKGRDLITQEGKKKKPGNDSKTKGKMLLSF